MNSLLAAAESKWLCVGDEVNVVAAIGQLDSQLRSDYAAAAIGRITGDADFHMRSLSASVDACRGVSASNSRGSGVRGLAGQLAKVDKLDGETESFED